MTMAAKTRQYELGVIPRILCLVRGQDYKCFGTNDLLVTYAILVSVPCSDFASRFTSVALANCPWVPCD